VKYPEDDGFTWWRVYGWLGLLVGVPYSIFHGIHDPSLSAFYFFLAITVGLLCVFILKYSRVAFLFATILSLNPLLWIINGIYLKNRWQHPLVLTGRNQVTDDVVPDAPFTEHEVSNEYLSGIPPLSPLSIEPSNDDFRKAAEEVERGDYDKGSWERLYYETDGDLAKTRARYIGQRAKQLAKEAAPRG